jgi:hypothetical protein
MRYNGGMRRSDPNYYRTWAAKNPEKVREYRRKSWEKAHSKEWERQLRKRYGVDAATYERMFVEQKGLCGLCDQPGLLKADGRVERLCVDHSHVTGRVRRLLCRACNFLVGRVEAQPSLHEKAFAYIRQYGDENA